MAHPPSKWLERFIKKSDPVKVPEKDPVQILNLEPGLKPAYKIGDSIGQQYRILDVIGKGGFGIVYVVYSEKQKSFSVLKTLQEQFLSDKETRQRFTKEAKIWVALGRHPYLVHADFVEDIAGRIFIGMEYIPPDEQGINTLQGFLDRQPVNLAQSLRWAIQICLGMEYAYGQGLRAHRDLKPANIMVTPQKNIKITDFGLAGSISPATLVSTQSLSAKVPLAERMTFVGTGFGTPTHMAPEQFENAAGCDERSDLYSFGIIAYQLVTSGRLPFTAPLESNYWHEMQRLHQNSPVPPLNSLLFPLIRRCLEKKPEDRYSSFSALRQDLQALLSDLTGEKVVPPKITEDRAWEWVNKAFSYSSLGEHELALDCSEKALRLDPNQKSAWLIKGGMLYEMGRYEEAIQCFDFVLALSPYDVNALSNKSAILLNLGRNQEAIHCIDVAIDHDSENAMLKYNKSRIFESLNRPQEALDLIDQALVLDPQHVNSWILKGNCLQKQGHSPEAIDQYYKALSLDPLKVEAWMNIGRCLLSQSSFLEALRVFDKALEIDRRNAIAWTNKGSCLNGMGKGEEAIRCYEKALDIDAKCELAWIAKAMAEDQLNYSQNALHSYRQFLQCSTGQWLSLVEFAKTRSGELSGNRE